MKKRYFGLKKTYIEIAEITEIAESDEFFVFLLC